MRLPEAVQHGRAQLMQPGERQLHLRLNSGGPFHPAAGRLPGQVIQQRGLADSRLAAYHEYAALARPDRRYQLVKQGALVAPAPQLRLASPGTGSGGLSPAPRYAGSIASGLIPIR